MQTIYVPQHEVTPIDWTDFPADYDYRKMSDAQLKYLFRYETEQVAAAQIRVQDLPTSKRNETAMSEYLRDMVDHIEELNLIEIELRRRMIP